MSDKGGRGEEEEKGEEEEVRRLTSPHYVSVGRRQGLCAVIWGIYLLSREELLLFSSTSFFKMATFVQFFPVNN